MDPHNLLKKDENFIWTEKYQKSFEKIKNLLCSKSILRILENKSRKSEISVAEISVINRITKEEGSRMSIEKRSCEILATLGHRKRIHTIFIIILPGKQMKEKIKIWFNESFRPAKRPFEIVSIDTIGGFGEVHG